MPVLTALLLSSVAGSLIARFSDRRNAPERGSNRVPVMRPVKGVTSKRPSARSETAVASAAEKETASQQKIALGAASLIGLGALTLPVVGFLGLPLLAYNYVHMMRKMWLSFRKKGNLVVFIFDTFSVTIALLLGHFFITAMLLAALATTNRLIAKTEREAQTDFSRIFGELSDRVWLLKDGVEIEIPLDDVQLDDLLVVHAGEMIPVDGTVAEGGGLVDQHLLTGESQPVAKESGASVLTSTLLISGRLLVRVEKCGADTVTGQIADTLKNAAAFKHTLQSRGEVIVEKGASRTLFASLAALPIIGLNHATALGYSGFGYQMRMAAPLMVLNFLRIASRQGILIKDGRALEVLHQVDAVVFDKTGTLTEEVPSIERVISVEGLSEARVLQLAASAEQRQRHPIAQAICRRASDLGLALLERVEADYAVGHGLRVELLDKLDGAQTVLIGSERFMRSTGIAIPEPLGASQLQATDQGFSLVYLASAEGHLLGALELRPRLRRGSQMAIDALRKRGVKTYIISGDQERPTRYLAEKLGVDGYFAETLPADKALHVERLQAEGRKVCFVGDGINDSMALQKADVSVSLHGASTIAQDTADVVLMSPELTHLPYLIGLSAELQGRMDNSEWMNNVSGFVCVSGILVGGMGITGAMALYAAGLLVNVSGAMVPLLKHPAAKTGAAEPTADQSGITG